MLAMETIVPVYFAVEDDALLSIYEQTQAASASQGSASAAEDSSLLQDNVAFVLCLDTLGRGDSLHLHVSKPPREGTLQHSFLRELETVAAHQFPEVRFSMVHKKINLAEDILAWEHERFAIRRLPAFTLSHLESHRDGQRSSIMDVRTLEHYLSHYLKEVRPHHVKADK
ncbi:hypothetical protein E2I00_002110, partial [Balaenoptera physalus]